MNVTIPPHYHCYRYLFVFLIPATNFHDLAEKLCLRE